MPLIINQGIHKIEEFKIYTETNAKLQIIKVALAGVGKIKVTFKFVFGPNKGDCLDATVPYDPNDKNAWLYRSLRAAVGQPYQEGESQQIDIEKVLLNKVITADLSERTYKDKEGKDRKGQKITYKVPEEIKDEDLPFSQPAQQPTVATTASGTTDADDDDSAWL